MIPFLVDMARLFELFVAEWLKLHIQPLGRVRTQERVQIAADGSLPFSIDLVLYDSTGVRCVLDTKYKISGNVSAADVEQVVAYAEAKGCRQAVLLYPTTLDRPLDARVGSIRVRSLTFALDGDLESAGRILLGNLIQLLTEEL